MTLFQTCRTTSNNQPNKQTNKTNRNETKRKKQQIQTKSNNQTHNLHERISYKQNVASVWQFAPAWALDFFLPAVRGQMYYRPGASISHRVLWGVIGIVASIVADHVSVRCLFPRPPVACAIFGAVRLNTAPHSLCVLCCAVLVRVRAIPQMLEIDHRCEEGATLTC